MRVSFVSTIKFPLYKPTEFANWYGYNTYTSLYFENYGVSDTCPDIRSFVIASNEENPDYSNMNFFA